MCASSFRAEGHDVVATRRTLLLATLAAGLPLGASSRIAQASKLDPAQTMITFPDAIKFVPWLNVVISVLLPQSSTLPVVAAQAVVALAAWVDEASASASSRFSLSASPSAATAKRHADE